MLLDEGPREEKEKGEESPTPAPAPAKSGFFSRKKKEAVVEEVRSQ